MGRTKAVLVRVTPEEHQTIRVKAAEAGLSMEGLARSLLLAERREPRDTATPHRGAGSTPAVVTTTAAQPIRKLSYAEQLRVNRGEKL